MHVTALELTGRNPVFCELLSIGYFVVRSPDVRRVVEAVRGGRDAMP